MFKVIHLFQKGFLLNREHLFLLFTFIGHGTYKGQLKGQKIINTELDNLTKISMDKWTDRQIGS